MVMKRIQKILIICLMIMICLSQPAYASKAKKGSLSTTYPCEGIEVELYYVASQSKNSKFKLEDRFAQYPIALADKTKDEWAGQAKALETYILRDHVTADYSGQTDRSGKIHFDNLERGLYLVTAKVHEEDGYVYTSVPYFITIPWKDANGKRQYNVTTKAKYEITPVSDKEVDYKVAKIWKDSNNKKKKRPKNITVQLLRNGEIYQEVQLDDGNNWQYTWKNLSSKYQWSAIEKKKTKGYIVSVSKQDTSFVIKNIYWDEEYYEETTTEKKPTTTEREKKKQSTEEKKTTQTPKTKHQTKKLPQTGQLWWPLPFLAFGGILCIGIGMIKQKRENNEKE